MSYYVSSGTLNPTHSQCDQSISQSKAIFAVDQNVTAYNIQSYNEMSEMSLNNCLTIMMLARHCEAVRIYPANVQHC